MSRRCCRQWLELKLFDNRQEVGERTDFWERWQILGAEETANAAEQQGGLDERQWYRILEQLPS